MDNHQLAIDQRRRGNAPDRHADFVVYARVLLPEQFSRSGIETVQMPHGPQGIGTAIVDGDAGPRPSRVPYIFVGAVVGEAPQAVARLPIKAVDPFRLTWIGLPVGDVYAAFGHGRAAIAAADADTPADRKLRAGELVHNAGFPPHAVASWATPLGPIVAHELTTARRQADYHAEQ